MLIEYKSSEFAKLISLKIDINNSKIKMGLKYLYNHSKQMSHIDEELIMIEIPIIDKTKINDLIQYMSKNNLILFNTLGQYLRIDQIKILE